LEFAIYYTIGAIVLYFLSDAILERIEVARGKRFEHRSLVFFVIIFVLAYGYMHFIDTESPEQAPDQPQPAAPSSSVEQTPGTPP
jgi:hypothetical protein